MTAGKPTALGGSRPMMGGGALGLPFAPDQGSAYNFPVGSYTFTAPKAGYWKFVLWGAGGTTQAASDSGASAGYCEYTRFLSFNEAVTLVVGAPGINGVSSSASTTATFADGKAVTAGGATYNGSTGVSVAGAASGGDVNLNGSTGLANGAGTAAPAGSGTGGGAGGGTNGGSGAPATLPFRGGAGGASATNPGIGAGAAQAGATTLGGTGFALAFFVRP